MSVLCSSVCQAYFGHARQPLPLPLRPPSKQRKRRRESSSTVEESANAAAYKRARLERRYVKNIRIHPVPMARTPTVSNVRRAKKSTSHYQETRRLDTPGPFSVPAGDQETRRSDTPGPSTNPVGLAPRVSSKTWNAKHIEVRVELSTYSPHSPSHECRETLRGSFVSNRLVITCVAS